MAPSRFLSNSDSRRSTSAIAGTWSAREAGWQVKIGVGTPLSSAISGAEAIIEMTTLKSSMRGQHQAAWRIMELAAWGISGTSRVLPSSRGVAGGSRASFVLHACNPCERVNHECTSAATWLLLHLRSLRLPHCEHLVRCSGARNVFSSGLCFRRTPDTTSYATPGCLQGCGRCDCLPRRQQRG